MNPHHRIDVNAVPMKKGNSMKSERTPAPGQGEHRNIARLLAVLDALSSASVKGLRLTDVVRAAGLGKTTAHRLLGGLMAAGLVEQDSETGRFFVGLKMLAWAMAAKHRFSIARLAEPALERLSRRTQDTVYLVARVGDEIVCLDAREGSFPIKVLTLSVGDRRPLGIGAGSLAILAALPEEEIERILATQADARARFPFDEVQLREMIAATKRNGYAYNNVHLFQGMETAADMAGIAVPIRRADGQPVAALHLTGVTSRLEPPRRDNIVTSLHHEARQLEAELGPMLDTVGLAATRAGSRPHTA
jgi:DNA-binding IclR family transcriptional regulator